MAKEKLSKFKWGLTSLLVLVGVGFYQFRELIYTEGWIEVSRLLQITEMTVWAFLAILLGLVIYAWAGGAARLLSWIEKGVEWVVRVRFLALLAFIALLAVYPFIIMGQYGLYLVSLYPRLAVLAVLVIVGAFPLKAWLKEKTWGEALVISLLVMAVAYNLASYARYVTDYPFAIAWSETSRYYYGSTFFAERIYGVDLPWPHNNFSRYLMQALPFFFSNLPLWAHRLWQAFLRFFFPYLAGFFLARRLGLSKKMELALVTLWAGLFIFMGPIHYQMLVVVVAMFWLFDSSKFWKSFVVVLLVSVWAGFSRVNWVPMPGLIAAAFYLMEQPLEGKDIKSLWKYLWQPAVWAMAGGLVGLAAQEFYVGNSGLDPEVLRAAFTSDLLWYRLWPNLSYEHGILLSILSVTGPLLFFTYWAMKGWRRHFLRYLGLTVILLVLFVGGVVVSVKIGGGTNLHNMDAYMTILLIMGVYFFYGKSAEQGGARPKVHWAVLALLVVIPAAFAADYGGQLPRHDYAVADQSLTQLQMMVDQANRTDGDILFVSERHLITFGYLQNVELTHDYEKMILMEMAMSGNPVYLNRFAEDMKNQRFSLIVHDGLPQKFKDKDEYSLAEENNVYYQRVTPWFQCAYKLAFRIQELGINVYIPKTNPACDW